MVTSRTAEVPSYPVILPPRAQESGKESLEPFGYFPSLHYSLRDRWLSILIYWSLTLFFSLVAPLAVFYSLYHVPSVPLEALLGFISSLMGIPQIIELFYRVYVIVRRDQGPLREDSRKVLFDVFQVEFICGVVIFVIMYTLSCSLARPIPELFLLAPAMLALFIGAQLLLTLAGFRPPIAVNSTLAGTPVKPGVFYLVEDIIAVEGGGGKAFRQRWKDGYDASTVLRNLVRRLTLWWGIGSVVIFTISVAVTFTCPLIVSFGLTLALFWAWALIWVAGSICWWRRSQKHSTLTHEGRTSPC